MFCLSGCGFSIRIINPSCEFSPRFPPCVSWSHCGAPIKPKWLHSGCHWEEGKPYFHRKVFPEWICTMCFIWSFFTSLLVLDSPLLPLIIIIIPEMFWNEVKSLFRKIGPKGGALHNVYFSFCPVFLNEKNTQNENYGPKGRTLVQVDKSWNVHWNLTPTGNPSSLREGGASWCQMICKRT